MSQYNAINAGETERFFTVVARASGAPITSGTVNYYLKAKNGANAGKWWRDSDETWQAAETANAMDHDADGHWEIDLTSSPFTADVRFLEYVKESGDLHVPDARHVVGVTPAAGSGANAVTITAEDGDGNPLENATITVTLSGVETNTLTTDASGEAVFSLADGTWTVTGYKGGYQHTPESLVVSGETSGRITLTQTTTPPTVTPDKSSVTITCYGATDNDADPTTVESGVTIQVQQTAPPSGDTGAAFDGSVYSFTSDTSGEVSLTLWRNAPYRWRRGTTTRHSQWYAFTPDVAVYALTSRVGADS